MKTIAMALFGIALAAATADTAVAQSSVAPTGKPPQTDIEREIERLDRAIAEAESLTKSIESTFDHIKTFRCDFTSSEGRRTSADNTVTNATRETFSDLVVDAIDRKKGTARFIGNAGGETTALIDGAAIINFIEETASGNLAILSIFKKETSFHRYKAVYSRHMAMLTGEWNVTQSYGECRALL